MSEIASVVARKFSSRPRPVTWLQQEVETQNGSRPHLIGTVSKKFVKIAELVVAPSLFTLLSINVGADYIHVLKLTRSGIDIRELDVTTIHRLAWVCPATAHLLIGGFYAFNYRLVRLLHIHAACA